MKTNYCIITDSVGSPMFWSEEDEQLVYCNTTYNPLVVTYDEAKKSIKQTRKNRKKWKAFVDDYKIVSVNFSEDVLKLLKESEI